MTIGIITLRERNPKTGRVEEVVDYAFNINSGKAVILPTETPQALGAQWDDNLGHYVLHDKTPRQDPRSDQWRRAH